MEYKPVRLIDEDFTAFRIGYFPTDISAAGEYHYAPPRGYTGIWYEPNKDTSWIGKKCWLVRERDGAHEMELAIDNGDCPTIPMLVAGEGVWRTYTLCCRVWPLACRGMAGIAFRYIDSRHFYLLALEAGARASLYRKQGDALDLLAQADFPYDADCWQELRVTAEEGVIRCAVGSVGLPEVRDDAYACGKIAIAATAPARFAAVTLDMEAEALRQAAREQRRAGERAREKQPRYPQPRLVKTLNLKDFGSARNVRFGDLTGSGTPDILFVQGFTNESIGDENMITCMTAVSLDGTTLWQTGEPDPECGVLTADLPVQIADVDGDGKNEVVYCKDFRLIIADGSTGAVKRWARTPKSEPVEKPTIYASDRYDRIVGDSIRICNFTGKSKPSDILLKDRYNNIWAYDSALNLLWRRSLNAGHFPMSFDINGDGRDELMVGHTLLDSAGNVLWQLTGMDCHVDEIVIGRIDPANGKRLIAMAGGEDGFLLADEDGRLLVQDRVGHAQRLSVANYLPEMPGLQICLTTFWGNTGIITMYDCKGNRLRSFEPGANGNVVSPVNWTGDGRELLLFSANTRYGGLYDGEFDQVVVFPQDGHPELCCDAVDLYGSGREELLAWDTGRMFVYTQDDSPRETRYAPVKYEMSNFSNYRGEYSFPAWKAEP